MNAIQNFAFEEKLVRVVDIDGQPWFAGKDVCGALDIQKHHQALDSLDPDERGTYSIGTPSAASGAGGGEQTMIVVSMPGVFRLIFRSRKPEAERFKRWLAHDVLPEIMRTGSYIGAPRTPVAAADPYRFASGDEEALGISKLKVDFIREVRITQGKASARALWETIGLPPIPPALPDTEPESCLQRLLDANTGHGNLSQLLAAAFAGDEAAIDLLQQCGVRVAPGTFTVANAHPWIRKLYRPTRWQQPYRFLRRLDGAAEAKVMKYGGHPSRGVELPAFYADDETFH